MGPRGTVRRPAGGVWLGCTQCGGQCGARLGQPIGSPPLWRWTYLPRGGSGRHGAVAHGIKGVRRLGVRAWPSPESRRRAPLGLGGRGAWPVARSSPAVRSASSRGQATNSSATARCGTRWAKENGVFFWATYRINSRIWSYFPVKRRNAVFPSPSDLLSGLHGMGTGAQTAGPEALLWPRWRLPSSPARYPYP